MVVEGDVFKKTKMSEKKTFGKGAKYSRKEVKLLHQVFRDLDKFGDGSVSLKELAERLPCVDHSSERLPPLAVLRALDVNHNGILTFKEMLLRLYPHATANDLEKLIKMASSTGYDPNEVEELFTSTDTNHDKRIEFDEFVEMLKGAFL